MDPQDRVRCFAFIVDGEIAQNLCFDTMNERTIAILLSNPTVVPNYDRIPEGWMWDGEKFYDPLESES